MRGKTGLTGILAITVVTPGAFLSGERSLAQPSRDEIVAQIAQTDPPVAQHDVLDVLAGDWTFETAFLFMDPPLDASGSAHAEWILGGRFLEFKATADDGDFAGLERLNLYGFDTRTNEYFDVGFDSLGTYFLTSYGGYDEESNAFTLEGEISDQGRATMYRTVLTIIDTDHFRQDVFAQNPLDTEQWMPVVQAEFTRAD